MKKILAAVAALLIVLGVAAPAYAIYHAYYPTRDGYSAAVGVAAMNQNDGDGVMVWQLDLGIPAGDCGRLGATTVYDVMIRTYTPVTHTFVARKDLANMEGCQHTYFYTNVPGPDKGCAYVAIDFTLNTYGGNVPNVPFDLRKYYGGEACP